MKYYHGLAGDIPFYFEEEVLEKSIETLESILLLGGIYSRRCLRDFGVDVISNNVNYNDDDYISICTDSSDGVCLGLESTYFTYVKEKIAIELKPNILKTCTFRNGEYKHLPGEEQIYKFIGVDCFSKVTVGLIDLHSDAIRRLEEICGPYGVEVASIDRCKTLIKR